MFGNLPHSDANFVIMNHRRSISDFQFAGAPPLMRFGGGAAVVEAHHPVHRAVVEILLAVAGMDKIARGDMRNNDGDLGEPDLPRAFAGTHSDHVHRAVCALGHQRAPAIDGGDGRRGRVRIQRRLRTAAVRRKAAELFSERA